MSGNRKGVKSNGTRCEPGPTQNKTYQDVIAEIALARATASHDNASISTASSVPSLISEDRVLAPSSGDIGYIPVNAFDNVDGHDTEKRSRSPDTINPRTRSSLPPSSHCDRAAVLLRIQFNLIIARTEGGRIAPNETSSQMRQSHAAVFISYNLHLPKRFLGNRMSSPVDSVYGTRALEVVMRDASTDLSLADASDEVDSETSDDSIPSLEDEECAGVPSPLPRQRRTYCAPYMGNRERRLHAVHANFPIVKLLDAEFPTEVESQLHTTTSSNASDRTSISSSAPDTRGLFLRNDRDDTPVAQNVSDIFGSFQIIGTIRGPPFNAPLRARETRLPVPDATSRLVSAHLNQIVPLTDVSGDCAPDVV
ncbi:hypothetical protein C8R43DRAFT_959693 [Mycena crocata]|nr:hypothetical protein C8R43DRAFT_959693 [Mycena crocata]